MSSLSSHLKKESLFGKNTWENYGWRDKEILFAGTREQKNELQEKLKNTLMVSQSMGTSTERVNIEKMS